MYISECIQYTADVVYQLPELSSQRKSYFLKKVENIQKRAKNPLLRTALIGNFNSGKSTFINAMIGQEILKMAWHETTAAPVMIVHHNREGVRILAETIDGENFLLEDRESRNLLEKKLSVQIPEEPGDAIACLSASNAIAQQIKRVEIRVKLDEKMRKICLIDTPGVNPGAVESKFHAQKTKDALQKYADATIILFQAAQVYSASFRKFLEENAAVFLNEAAFGITMLDVVEESERTDLLDFVTCQLEQSFGLKNPKVFGCCAKAALLKQTDCESRRWAKQFDDTKEELLLYMEAHRKQIIRRQLGDLLQDLVKELDEEAKQRIVRLDQKKAALEETAIFHMGGQMDKDEYKRVYAEKYKEYLYDQQRLEMLSERCGQMRKRLMSYYMELKRHC